MEPATRWFDGSFAPIRRSDERFARQYRCGLPPGFPLASSSPRIVHHLSGLNMYALTLVLFGVIKGVFMELKRTGLGFLLIPPSTIPLNRSLMHPIKFPLRVLRLFTLVSRLGFSHPYTRIHVELLGPCFKTGRLTPCLTGILSVLEVGGL